MCWNICSNCCDSDESKQITLYWVAWESSCVHTQKFHIWSFSSSSFYFWLKQKSIYKAFWYCCSFPLTSDHGSHFLCSIHAEPTPSFYPFNIYRRGIWEYSSNILIHHWPAVQGPVLICKTHEHWSCHQLWWSTKSFSALGASFLDVLVLCYLNWQQVTIVQDCKEEITQWALESDIIAACIHAIEVGSRLSKVVGTQAESELELIVS